MRNSNDETLRRANYRMNGYPNINLAHTRLLMINGSENIIDPNNNRIIYSSKDSTFSLGKTCMPNRCQNFKYSFFKLFFNKTNDECFGWVLWGNELKYEDILFLRCSNISKQRKYLNL